MKSLRFTPGARLRVLAAAAALTCAAVTTSAGADCPAVAQPIQDAFAVAEDADVSYLPFSLGQAQDEYASLADAATPDQPETAPIVLAGSFEFD